MSGKPYKEYYKELYALQDGVFQIVADHDFYLTGGTALSRFYLHHRYSDDLDFFVHNKAHFFILVCAGNGRDRSLQEISVYLRKSVAKCIRDSPVFYS